MLDTSSSRLAATDGRVELLSAMSCHKVGVEATELVLQIEIRDRMVSYWNKHVMEGRRDEQRLRDRVSSQSKNVSNESVKTFRLFVQHVSPGNVMRATNRTFQARSKRLAEAKADRFVESARLSAMLYEVREE